MKVFGIDCAPSPSEAGALGALIDGPGMNNVASNRYVLAKAVDDAKRIAAAGDAGVDANDVQRYNVDTLKAAGVDIVEQNYRYYLDKPPIVKWYLTPVPSSKETKPGYR